MEGGNFYWFDFEESFDERGGRKIRKTKGKILVWGHFLQDERSKSEDGKVEQKLRKGKRKKDSTYR